MTTITQAHHGIGIRDLDAMTAAIAAIGFSEPEGEAPREYRNEPGDAIGQMIVPTLGEGIRTWFVSNPATGQQLDLVELLPRSTLPRPGTPPAQGDITIGIPAADPDAALAAMQAGGSRLAFSKPEPDPAEDGMAFTIDGQHFVLSRREAPATWVHYHPSGLDTARRFYEEVLGLTLKEIDAAEPAERRFAITGAGGRVEAVVHERTPIAPAEAGKRYLGANHFRLLNLDLATVAERVAATGLGRWFFAPNEAGFAQILGPTGEFIELYDRGADGTG